MLWIRFPNYLLSIEVSIWSSLTTGGVSINVFISVLRTKATLICSCSVIYLKMFPMSQLKLCKFSFQVRGKKSSALKYLFPNHCHINQMPPSFIKHIFIESLIHFILDILKSKCWECVGSAWWLSSRFHLQCRRCGFDPWVEKIPWRRTWQPTPIFLPGEFDARGAWRATVPEVKKESDVTWILNNTKC